MPLKSDYNHIICIMEGETKNIRFVLKIYRFVLRLLNISFCGLYPVSNTKISLSGYLPRTRLIIKLLMILQCRRREKVSHTRSNWVAKMLQSIESSHHCRTSRRSIYLCRSTSMTPSMTDGNGKMPLIGANINSSCDN